MQSGDIFDLDDQHPIPNLEVVDINVVKKGGGSDLRIIIASPLQDDVRSLERLLMKIERYFSFTKSPEFIAESGLATVGNTKVIVCIHPDSSPVAFDLLERCKPWAIENEVTLEIDRDIVLDRRH
jgi:hypothetical protein